MHAFVLLFLLTASDGPYKLKVLDIVFRIEDIGGKVEDIEVRKSETEVRVGLNADVLFDFDKADLLPKAEETLQKAADVVKENYKGGTVRIEGHTDAKGSEAYNQALSLRRADAVKQWLVKHGLTSMTFSSEGFGASKPVAANQKADGSDDPTGRQRNRRVELVIAGGKS